MVTPKRTVVLGRNRLAVLRYARHASALRCEPVVPDIALAYLADHWVNPGDLELVLLDGWWFGCRSVAQAQTINVLIECLRAHPCGGATVREDVLRWGP